MYRTIFFDLDGTLTDSKAGIINSVRWTLQRMGAPVPGEDTLQLFIGPPLQDSFERFCGFTPERAGEAVAVFRERYLPVGQYENRAAPGAEALLRRLKERGYTLALASSKPEELCVSICQRFGFTPHLALIVGSPPLGDRSKAEVIEAAMAGLGLTEADRSSILMVGDRKFDVLGARECGVACVGVKFFGYAPEGELEEAGAEAVVETIDQLEAFILSH